HAALFEKLDANHDGVLTSDEVPEEQRRLFERLLRQADRNHDGKLSREEFVAGLSGDRGAADGGEKADAPKGSEGNTPRRPLGAPDAAGAGRPGPQMMMGLVIFRALDTNGDGQLDA